MKNLIVVYITNPSLQEAQKVAKHLLQKRLIACANIMQSDSMYWWEGDIATEAEAILVAKTLENVYNELQQEVKKVHAYSVPCIVKISAQANDAYLKFVNDEIIQK